MISNEYASLLEPPLICARVIAQDKGSYLITTAEGEIRATIRGSMLFETSEPSLLPVVGDFVAANINHGCAVIEKLLARKNLFARRSVWGSHCMQAIAANIDTLFITMAVNRDFNLRRIERYAISAAANSVPFAVLLNKSDLVDDISIFIDSVKSLLANTPVIAIKGIDCKSTHTALSPFCGDGKTLAFVGSSGVGKSTVINTLLQSKMLDVQESRTDDDRGRHTTTRRMLLELGDGTAIIDTPGMREFALADAAEGINSAFAEITGLAQNCRYSDCKHICEPGCAVRESLDEARLESFRKLEREAAFETRKNDPRARSAERLKWRAIHKENRRRQKDKYE